MINYKYFCGQFQHPSIYIRNDISIRIDRIDRLRMVETNRRPWFGAVETRRTYHGSDQRGGNDCAEPEHALGPGHRRGTRPEWGSYRLHLAGESVDAPHCRL